MGSPIVPVPPETTLSYDQSAALMNDASFQNRVKVACLKFSDSISNEQPNIPWHNSKYAWAMRTAQNPVQMALSVTPPCVMDAAVQAAGSAIADDALQASVEATVQKLY